MPSANATNRIVGMSREKPSLALSETANPTSSKPATISMRQTIRAMSRDSLNRYMPMIAVPTAPMPTQIA